MSTISSEFPPARPSRRWWQRLLAWWRPRPRRPRALPPRVAPPTVAAPARTRILTPWEGLVCAPSAAPDRVRTVLLGSLMDRLDQVEHPGERVLIEGLVRALGDSVLDFPLFPDVTLQLDRLLRTGDPSVTEVASLIRREPDLVRRVWLAGGGAAFARKAASLDHAIARVGFDALWRLVMAASMESTVFKVRGMQRAVDRARAQSIAAAELSAWISAEQRGDVYLAGLLHPVGRLLLYRTASPAGYRGPLAPTGVVERLGREWGPSLGLLVAQAWGLSAGVASAIGFYPNPDAAPTEHRELAQINRAAVVGVLVAQEALDGRDCGGAEAVAAAGLSFVDPERLFSAACEHLRGGTPGALLQQAARAAS